MAGPWYAEQEGWGTFRTFLGGLLTTNGLDHVLGPITDDATFFNYPHKHREHHRLHGRLSTTPARLTRYGVDDEFEPRTLIVEGETRQATVYGENYVVRRRIEVPLGGRTIHLSDTVQNAGYATTPYMIMYTVNAGWPLLSPAATVSVGGKGPRNRTASAAGEDWSRVGPPLPGAAERVWEHDPSAGADGYVHAAILNPDVGGGRPVGLEVAYDPSGLPHLHQWTSLEEGVYVVGLEPTNAPLGGRSQAKDAGTLVMLTPGEVVHHRLSISLLWGADEVEGARQRCMQQESPTTEDHLSGKEQER
jgi:hypothetical protein